MNKDAETRGDWEHLNSYCARGREESKTRSELCGWDQRWPHSSMRPTLARSVHSLDETSERRDGVCCIPATPTWASQCDQEPKPGWNALVKCERARASIYTYIYIYIHTYIYIYVCVWGGGGRGGSVGMGRPSIIFLQTRKVWTLNQLSILFEFRGHP